MQYTRQQLIDALNQEYVMLTHDSYDPDDMSPDEYQNYLNSLSIEQLIDETCVDFDDDYTLDDYIQLHSWLLLWGIIASQ